MNKKGQALIEFVLILPVLIILLFSIIDFGNIMITKNNLESEMNEASTIVKNTNDLSNVYDEVSNKIKDKDKKIEISLQVNNEDNYITLSLSKSIKTITPGLNLILGYPYKISVERTIIYEK
ncbi:MAG: TadE/TadG family type IV pilus assembly protein [bacterium]|nr:TadE/TadG family type IV pilus assembly protein [bacterium]